MKGPAVLASQIHRFIVSLLHIMLFHMISALKERKNEKKRNKMATEKIDITDSLDKFLTTYKQTHVSVYGERRR